MTEINLNSLNQNKLPQKFLTGRDNGIAAYEKFKLENHNPSDKLVLIADDSIVISNSYLLGMLTGLFKKYTNKQEFLKKLDTERFSKINQVELMRGINRGFRPPVNPLS